MLVSSSKEGRNGQQVSLQILYTSSSHYSLVSHFIIERTAATTRKSFKKKKDSYLTEGLRRRKKSKITTFSIIKMIQMDPLMRYRIQIKFHPDQLISSRQILMLRLKMLTKTVKLRRGWIQPKSVPSRSKKTLPHQDYFLFIRVMFSSFSFL